MVKYVEKKWEAELGAWISIISYIILAISKLIVGSVAHSDGVKADGWNNFSDIIASVAILIGIKIAKKPRDHNHPYGHSRAENISSLVAAFMMMSIGIDVIIEGISSLFHSGAESAPEPLAAFVAIVSAFAMLAVYSFNARLAKRTNSQALAAAAKDHLSDALVSIGTVVGIAGAQVHLLWLDPLVAVLIGGMICKTAWGVFMETSHALTDGFDEHILTTYKHEIATVDGVKNVADIKARMLGNYVILEVTIHVDPHLTVVKSHEIADEVERLMKQHHNIAATHVHIEPERIP
ncbi:cation diffusion facilitator family transporter [Parageobacillus thermoglucosidasius]|uniref:Transporter n=3 Tax=Anoxybacillaceae TaxID=3120669 RepID=A0AAN0YPM3_PARTM|nr:cation diffusion facilitator family transporter [Parageobacillus thermoglucosidasius]AEH47734.1 cation diffusion facilitator family transporter [Parageobacillus thermoglucosidasius C56-YS93]ALF11026.1 transporter [Parageobacillus thermoglucosidasius]ANZ31103.1 transporter [Parageobacillus thermoglucosidasius]APM81840.1 transporter [Parageobacillus thermoglucosidasius]KJX67457.1 transporter [Parageobacillus thermoglucosidasius]